MTLRGACGLAELFLFINLLSAIKGEPQLIGSSEPVVGLVDHYVILPCSLQPAESVTEKTVEWTRSDLDDSSFIHIFRQGRLLYDVQNPSFHQRTSLFQQELKNGNMSLKLSYLQLSDKGTYICKLVAPELETFIQVLVGAVSEPIISHESTEGTRAVLKCDAKNWYPKPEMEWRDGKGRIVPHDDNNTEHDEYYSVFSRITVEMTANDIYTCTVRQQDIRQSRETNYTIPFVYREIMLLKNSKSALMGCLIVFGLVILALILWILMYVCGRRFECVRKTIRRDETDGLNRKNQESEIKNLREQVAHLQQEKERLEREVSRLKEEAEKCQRENEDLRRLASCSRVTAGTEPQRPNSPGNQ